MTARTALPSPALGLFLCGLAWAAVLLGCSERAPASVSVAPVVAGLTRPGLDARTRGLVLLGELGCVQCHQQSPDQPQADPHRGPDLATAGGRVRGGYMIRFLADPQRAEPGTTMPDLLRALDAGARLDAASALAEYLRSFGAPADEAREPADPLAAQRGRRLFHEIGCAACHAPRDEAGTESPLAGSVPLGPLADKYTLQGLRAFLLAPLTARPAARMPDLHLSPSEAHDLGHYLLAPGPSDGADGAVAPAALAATKVAVGRALFAERGCVHCHALPDPDRASSRTAQALRELDSARGCLSGAQGSWPYYALTQDQRADIVAALAAADAPLTDERRIQQHLAARNCTACHQRGEFGGIAPERNPYFVSTDPSIGPEGRVPPPLTGVGAKLQRPWLVDAVAHGQSVRPYLRTRMPAFGAAFGEELAGWLERVDQLPPIALTLLPEDEDQARAVTNLGRELVGDKGMSCHTCHTFAGELSGTIGAVDLVDSTAQRLRPEWFAHFLRTPLEFKPGTLMPQYFPGGVSVRPELGGGDTARQIDAMWHYLAGGRNVRKPSGLQRSPIELVVGDETVILRRAVQNTGKRGISVGYPGGVNLTFDAEHLGLNQLWWGRFLDASPVWSEQGSGEARILGKERATLPNGPAFVVLAGAATPWPAASRRDLGHGFLGYDLDAEQRPVFRYVCEDVTISDAPIAVREALAPENARLILRRTLTFASGADKTLQFRAARDASIEQRGADRVQVGKSLLLRLPPSSFRIRPADDQQELLVEIAIRQGRAELAIDYAWREELR